MSSSFGKFFRVHSFGESHSDAVGVIIDGCPPGHRIDFERIQVFLDRRRPGQNDLVSPRQEPDRLVCLSGIQDGVSLGGPIMFMVKNKDRRQSEYQSIENSYRPSHADYTTEQKYGVRPRSGGGRASARETIARVIAGAVAEQILDALHPRLRVFAYVDAVKHLEASPSAPLKLTRALIDAHPTRCPDKKLQGAMADLIASAKHAGDSLGGTIRCICLEPPAGLGEPVFDKLEAELAKAMMSLPASKGFEIGSGFAGTRLLGSQHNDAFEYRDSRIRTKTNHSGGVQGGISNGEAIIFRVAFKPVSTIAKTQDTVDRSGRPQKLEVSGRHDPCVLPRAVPMVEAMTLMVLVEHSLRQLGLSHSSGGASSRPFENDFFARK